MRDIAALRRVKDARPGTPASAPAPCGGSMGLCPIPRIGCVRPGLPFRDAPAQERMAGHGKSAALAPVSLGQIVEQLQAHALRRPKQPKLLPEPAPVLRQDRRPRPLMVRLSPRLPRLKGV